MLVYPNQDKVVAFLVIQRMLNLLGQLYNSGLLWLFSTNSNCFYNKLWHSYRITCS